VGSELCIRDRLNVELASFLDEVWAQAAPAAEPAAAS
jgi:hypothetical protein